jgi:hypothetical protein
MADPDFSKNLKEQFLDRKQMGSVNKKKAGSVLLNFEALSSK